MIIILVYAIYATKSLKNNINECSNELTKIRKIYDKKLENLEKNERLKYFMIQVVKVIFIAQSTYLRMEIELL